MGQRSASRVREDLNYIFNLNRCLHLGGDKANADMPALFYSG
jgi:hypothetical protein